MRTARPLRPAALVTLALFVATGVGVPLHHHADHDGDERHLTAGGHGHGATLVVRDLRTERPATTVDAAVTSTIAPLSEPAAVERRTVSRSLPSPRGRSPPAAIRPRAPPSSS